MDTVEKLRKECAAKIRPNAIMSKNRRYAATVVSGCLLNFRVPPNLFSILKRAALQIFTGRRKHSFSTVSMESGYSLA
jgi:hypothetical protein